MPKPYLLDNQAAEDAQAGRHHGEALAWFVANHGAEHPLSVATGYVDLGGLHRLAQLADARATRLLIGAAPAPGLGAQLPLGTFELHRERLRDERDFSRFPPSRAAQRLAAVEAWLAREEVEVRRYTQEFLHGKAYMLGSAEDPQLALVTSANLTGAGLWRNRELGLTNYDPPVAGLALEWFAQLWATSADYTADLRALLFPDPGLIDPQTVHLRALLELQWSRSSACAA